jgi:hypothetical protein
MPRLLPLVALASALLGCATAPKPPAPPVPMAEPPAGGPGDFSPKGEVTWKDLTGVSPPRRVSFDDWRVQGPTVSLSRSSDGRWVGKARGLDVALTAVPGKLSGGDIDLAITFGDKGDIVVEGLWGGKRVRLVLAKDRISGALPGGPIDMTDMGTGMFNSYQGMLMISGPPDMPQIAIALLDAMVR